MIVDFIDINKRKPTKIDNNKDFLCKFKIPSGFTYKVCTWLDNSFSWDGELTPIYKKELVGWFDFLK